MALTVDSLIPSRFGQWSPKKSLRPIRSPPAGAEKSSWRVHPTVYALYLYYIILYALRQMSRHRIGSMTDCGPKPEPRRLKTEDSDKKTKKK